MLVQKFDKFLQSVDLKSYRDKYRPIKIVEMDLPKEIQAINLLDPLRKGTILKLRHFVAI